MEKNDKRKIASSLTRILVAFLLISSWAVLGIVLALSTAKLQMGGVISFTANDISAKVTGSVTGAKNDYTFDDINITPTTTATQLNSMQSTWNGWELSFDKSQNSMVISVRIQNLGDDALWVTITDGIGADDNLTITRTYLEYGETTPVETSSLTQSYCVWGEGEYLDLTITINMIDKKTKVENLTFNLDIELSRFEPEALSEAYYPTLAFTYDDTNKTASVSANSLNKPTGGLVIPSQVLHSEEVYSVTSVGMDGFDDTNITSVVIPQGVTTIGDSAFSGCLNLKSATMPSSLVTIASFAFYNCTSLRSIVIPASVVTIDESAFEDCTSLTSAIFKQINYWSVDDYEGDIVDLSAAALANTTTAATYLTSTYASYHWTCMPNASLYETLTFTYNNDAPANTASVKANSSNKPTGDIEIPSQVFYDGIIYTITSIDSFSSCTDLTSVKIPSSVTSIGKEAFRDCSSLTSITIPASVISIGDYSFAGCSALESISVDSENTVYTSYENGIYKGTELVVGCKNTVIKAGTTSIGESAFYGSSLTSIELPEGLTKICALAFNNCSSLTSINIPASVTSMELVTKTGGIYSRPLHIFNGCTSLESITVSSGNTVYSSYGNGVYEGTKLVIGCKTTIIKAGTTTIGTGAFCDCTSLTSISIPEGVTVMEYGAFLGCTSLKSITLPSGMTELNGLINTGLESLEIPEGITELTSSQFSLNSSLTSVVIPNSVTCIELNAFHLCNNITSIVFKNPVGWSVSGTMRDYGDFTNDYGAEELSDPSNAVKVVSPYLISGSSGSYTADPIFTRNTNVLDYTNLEFVYDDTNKTATVSANSSNKPTGALEIPSKIYYNATEYYTVTKIDSNGFSCCTGLTSITIPLTVTEIGANAFEGCTSLTSATFDNPVEWIIDDIILSNTDLANTSTAATYLTTTYSGYYWICGSEAEDSSAYPTLSFFSADDDERTIRVSANSSNKPTGDLVIPSLVKYEDKVYIVNYMYQFWNLDLTSIYIPSTITTIDHEHFRADTLTKIIVSEGNTTFYSYENGVYQGTELVLACKTTIIKEGTTSIGHLAFRSAFYMTSIVLPSTLTSISASAFNNCQHLESVAISSGLISIGGNAFYNCVALTSITIPSSVTEIGGSAFRGCTSLTSVIFENTYGWMAGDTELSSTDLADPSTAATYLKSTYYSSNWTRTVLDASEFETLTFTYDEDNKTATVYANSSNKPTGDLVIPSIVLYNGEEYTVTSMKARAFYECTGLTSVKIPSTVTKISNYAFYGCTGLTSITIPSSVTSLGQYAFGNCSSLTSITIPASVTSITTGAFASCTLLESISVDSENTVYTSYENGIYKGTELVVGCKNTVIKAGTTSIGESAFNGCTGLTSINIPSSVKTIGVSVFQNCTSLASVTLSSNLETIGGSAFWGCSSLTSITIPASVTSIAIQAFKNCSALASATFENPNGWMMMSNAVTADLSDTSVAASYLKNSLTYAITRSDTE